MTDSVDSNDIDGATLEAVSLGQHHDPHSVLGNHLSKSGVIVRTLKPLAKSVNVVDAAGKEFAMTHLHNGIWQAIVQTNQVFDYRISAIYEDGDKQSVWVSDDPYRHLPTIGDLDLHLISEGRHEELWRALGSHLRQIDGALGASAGASFAVWAPNAKAVRVVGDFNHWVGSAHAMRNMGASGVWELFVPGVTTGMAYKYEILTAGGSWVTKADPMARATEVPPKTASLVTSDEYQWNDQSFMAARASRDALKSPMSTYELHVGSWRQGLTYRELAAELIPYLTKMGFTHVEFMPLAEHPFGGSWGYQVTGYYAPTSRFGDAADLKFLIDELHNAGIGVILDWVPAHFPKDEWALANFDGQPLYEHSDPRRGEHPDWGTLIFDFGRREVRNFLVANANYWFEEFHIDALRVDAVASMLYLDYSRKDGQWLPNEHGGRENLDAIRFLQEANATVYRRYPGIMMIAEESTSFAGVTQPTDANGLGFGFKWNMGWMHDTLEYIQKDPMYRKHHHGELTFSMLYAYNEKFVLPISHDEVVHGKGSLVSKMPGDRWQQLANVRAYLAYMWSHPGKQLLFMGQEFAQLAEWSADNSIDWWLLEQPSHESISNLVSRLNQLYIDNATLWQRDHQPDGFTWIDGGNADQNVLTFLRHDDEGNTVAVAINFAGAPHNDFVLGLPQAGTWLEVLNTDALEFGGSGIGNLGKIQADGGGSHGQPHSAKIVLPPLAAVWFKPLV